MAVLALPSLPTITSAFLLKLTTSLDDLLWLSPFLSLSPSVQNKLKHSVVYFCICVVVTMLAFVFGTSLLALTSTGGSNNEGGHHGYWNPERFLSIFSASVLLYIARNDYTEWKEENYNKHRNNHHHHHKPESPAAPPSRAISPGGSTTVELATRRKSQSKTHQLRSRGYLARQSSSRHVDDLENGGGDSGGSCQTVDSDTDGDDSDNDSDDDEIRQKIQEASKSLKRFVTVCVMGTIDDMIVFSAFVAGGAGSIDGGSNQSGGSGGSGSTSTSTTMKENYLALFIGTTFAAILIVTISWFFSEIECFKKFVKKIPMWALLTGIALYILAMGLI